jgi:predicted negative regulator of RcsB-dependent stress response
MLAGVANAIGLATLGVAILAIAAAIGWLYYVRHRSKVEAAAEVQKIAPEHVRAYLDAADIPGMVADQVAQIMAQRGGLSAEEQAQELSEDPE